MIFKILDGYVDKYLAIKVKTLKYITFGLIFLDFVITYIFVYHLRMFSEFNAIYSNTAKIIVLFLFFILIFYDDYSNKYYKLFVEILPLLTIFYILIIVLNITLIIIKYLIF